MPHIHTYIHSVIFLDDDGITVYNNVYDYDDDDDNFTVFIVIIMLI